MVSESKPRNFTVPKRVSLKWLKRPRAIPNASLSCHTKLQATPILRFYTSVYFPQKRYRDLFTRIRSDRGRAQRCLKG